MDELEVLDANVESGDVFVKLSYLWLPFLSSKDLLVILRTVRSLRYWISEETTLKLQVSSLLGYPREWKSYEYNQEGSNAIIRGVADSLQDIEKNFSLFASKLEHDLKHWRRTEELTAKEFLSGVDSVANSFDGPLFFQLFKTYNSTYSLLILLHGLVRRQEMQRDELYRKAPPGPVPWEHDVHGSALKGDAHLITTLYEYAMQRVVVSGQRGHRAPFGSILLNLSVSFSMWGAHNPLGFRLRDTRKHEYFYLKDVLRHLEAALHLPALSDKLPDKETETVTNDDMWLGDMNEPQAEPTRDFMSFALSTVGSHDGSTSMSCLRTPTISCY